MHSSGQSTHVNADFAHEPSCVSLWPAIGRVAWATAGAAGSRGGALGAAADRRARPGRAAGAAGSGSGRVARRARRGAAAPPANCSNGLHEPEGLSIPKRRRAGPTLGATVASAFCRPVLQTAPGSRPAHVPDRRVQTSAANGDGRGLWGPQGRAQGARAGPWVRASGAAGPMPWPSGVLRAVAKRRGQGRGRDPAREASGSEAAGAAPGRRAGRSSRARDSWRRRGPVGRRSSSRC